MSRRVFQIVVACLLLVLPVMAMPSDTEQESCANNNGRERLGNAFIQIKQPVSAFPVKIGLISTKGVGSSAPLSEPGFRMVQAECCTLEMVEFIRRLVLDVSGQIVCHEGGLAGMAHWYDCEDDGNSFDALKKSIASDSRAMQGDCAWIGVPGSCPEMASTCPIGTGTLAPCKGPETTQPPPATTQPPQPPAGCSNFPVSYKKYNPKQLFVCGCRSSAFASGVKFELAGETVEVSSSFNSACSGDCKETGCVTVNHTPNIGKSYAFGDPITLK